jgi:alpha-galactosidase
MRAKTVSGHKTSYIVLESGLSDHGLRLNIKAEECLMLPETLYYSFEGDPADASERLHRYLLKRFPDFRRPEAVYNTWFYRFDEIDADGLEAQILAAKDIGCRYFVVDSGWYGDSADWETLVGDWRESKDKAFYGKLAEFADHVRSHGLKFGLWMDPESAAPGSPVYREHKDWFMPGDAVIFDLENPDAYDYVYGEITRLVKIYSLSWMKVDFNLKLKNDLTGNNFYRYYRAWNGLMERISAENPGCVFEGCASGGHRTDIENTLKRFAGQFISDTVNPLEVLNMRRNAMSRMLPQCLGTWLVAQQIDFPQASYFERGSAASGRKTLVCADAWWSKTLDLDVDFCMKAMVMGNAGFSGDISSFDEGSRETIRKWIGFYHDNELLFKNAVCCALTAERGINDQRGWHVFQYSLADYSRIILFVFRMKDNQPKMQIYPKHIKSGENYKVITDGETAEITDGDMIDSMGLLAESGDPFKVFSAHVIELQLIRQTE